MVLVLRWGFGNRCLICLKVTERMSTRSTSSWTSPTAEEHRLKLVLNQRGKILFWHVAELPKRDPYDPQSGKRAVVWILLFGFDGVATETSGSLAYFWESRTAPCRFRAKREDSSSEPKSRWFSSRTECDPAGSSRWFRLSAGSEYSEPASNIFDQISHVQQQEIIEERNKIPSPASQSEISPTWLWRPIALWGHVPYLE